MRNIYDCVESIIHSFIKYRLTVPDSISTRTLEDMDRAISNFKMGEVSPTVDLSDF
jgi:hypothetical protein